ncbi:MAG TPA: hypothetical protein GXZ35_07930 [Acholeplasmataceae bacterium]|nr:hypothetical protein [Acholeplasmataceae bacterium]
MDYEKKVKNYRKDNKLLTLRQYNRYAQQAYRRGIPVAKYLSDLGWEKTWGKKRK